MKRRRTMPVHVLYVKAKTIENFERAVCLYVRSNSRTKLRKKRDLDCDFRSNYALYFAYQLLIRLAMTTQT